MFTTVRKCKRLYIHRCLVAMACSIPTQFILLALFLLSVNFHIFHLFGWITETCSTMFSFYTWLAMINLIAAVMVYGMLLARSHLAVKHYYTSRFQWLKGTAVQKGLFLTVHVAVGYVTAWLYGRYLHVDYRFLQYKCYGIDCINAKYLFLMGAGISAGGYHFLKKNLRKDPEVEFPVIQEPRLARIRSLLYSTLYNSHIESFVPLVWYAFIFRLLGDGVNQFLARRYNLYADTSLSSLVSVATSLRLLFYSWILMSQILSNLNLTQKFFNILLSEEEPFPIEKNIIMNEIQKRVTLVEALAMSEIPVIQNLAALEFYKISAPSARDKRYPIFALSIFGGHPNNWNQLYPQCLSIMNAFIEELRDSMKNISTMKSSPLFCKSSKLTDAELAEKILLRQYNAAYGIRRMATQQYQPPPIRVSHTKRGSRAGSLLYRFDCSGAERIISFFNKISKQFEKAFNTAFYTIPRLFYMFGEADDAKTTFLLSNSQTIVWVIQGLAGIFAASLVEDRYGVVQSELPRIIRTLLELKNDLDQLTNQNLYGKKVDRNLVTLKSAVTRSLYQIVTVFADYLPDIFDDPWELCSLQCFLDYKA